MAGAVMSALPMPQPSEASQHKPMTPEQATAADLHNANDKAQRAYAAQYRSAMHAQLNDKTGFFS